MIFVKTNPLKDSRSTTIDHGRMATIFVKEETKVRAKHAEHHCLQRQVIMVNPVSHRSYQPVIPVIQLFLSHKSSSSQFR